MEFAKIHVVISKVTKSEIPVAHKEISMAYKHVQCFSFSDFLENDKTPRLDG